MSFDRKQKKSNVTEPIFFLFALSTSFPRKIFCFFKASREVAEGNIPSPYNSRGKIIVYKI